MGLPHFATELMKFAEKSHQIHSKSIRLSSFERRSAGRLADMYIDPSCGLTYEQPLNQLTFQEVTLKRDLSSLGEAINIIALENWEAAVAEYLADLKAGVDELKAVTPQTPEEQHEVFKLKKRIVDTLVDRIEIDKERNLHVQIRVNLIDILGKDARNETKAGAQIREGEIYSRMPDLYRAGVIFIITWAEIAVSTGIEQAERNYKDGYR
jgi:hypothetical protein